MVFCHLQQVAISSNKILTLQFNIPSNSYSFQNNSVILSKNVTYGVVDYAKGPPSLPNKIINKPITFKNNQVIFSHDGKINPGTIYLSDKLKRYLYAITIPISQVSLIRKYKYLNKQWILIN